MLFGGGFGAIVAYGIDDVLDAGWNSGPTPRKKGSKTSTCSRVAKRLCPRSGCFSRSFLIKPAPSACSTRLMRVGRRERRSFAALVEQMSLHSQIILITHNKRTMERAGTLYGVTNAGKGG